MPANLTTRAIPAEIDDLRIAIPAVHPVAVRESSGSKRPMLALSLTGTIKLDSLISAAYDTLGVINVSTQVSGKPTNRTKPFTVSVGATVLDLVREIHRDFDPSLKYANAGRSATFEGQTVGRDHELPDADVVELHV